MIKTQIKQLTFAEYLTYDDGSDRYYELEDGELLLINSPTFNHALISRFLINAFESEILRLTLPWLALFNVGVRTSFNRSRIPDISIVSREQVSHRNESAILESPILLAVEIVSPESRTRDYRYKRSEYGTIGISEYWIVDPEEQKITILFLEEGFYEISEYRNSESIVSRTFPELSLTVEQILRA